MTREWRAIKAACPNLHAIPARKRREGNVVVLEYAHGDVVPTPRATVLPVRKRLKKERRARKRLQEQLDLEIKRRTQLEEALKATGASSEQVRAITENVTAEARTSSEPPEASPVHSQSQQQSSQQQPPQQPLQQQQAAAQQYREAQVPRPSQQPSTPEKPAWGYGLDLIGSQASAFWQNYQESLVQELELERKSRQHQAAERDQVKSPLQGALYKNTRLFSRVFTR
ncbi:hypothetical protein G5I_14001 [Acromyrmex echinatior]|uniref:Uncharacterized protein n=1 Tax=Acromyrmex echinatior TaxID=103372 RepID=F4X6N3_ACREC|nr:hypothetical protein G5I_14001 [Acromyrmex echinatior]